MMNSYYETGSRSITISVQRGSLRMTAHSHMLQYISSKTHHGFLCVRFVVQQFHNQIARRSDKSFIIARTNQRQQAASFIKQISIFHLFNLGVQQSDREMEDRARNDG